MAWMFIEGYFRKYKMISNLHLNLRQNWFRGLSKEGKAAILWSATQEVPHNASAIRTARDYLAGIKLERSNHFRMSLKSTK